ncbi:MAG: type II secretion system protein [Candidatus Dojkabacteria bacterium]
MRKSFKAFTLVEMLIVMGIIIILMAVGITAGRFAINRANDVAHRNAVDNFYTAAQAYYADNRVFPAFENFNLALNTPDDDNDDIGKYMDDGAFDGGTKATYYYVTDSLDQEVLICVSLYGSAVEDAAREGEFYCNGNAFGSTNITGLNIISDKVVPKEDGHTSPAGATFSVSQEWDGDDWGGLN